MKIRLEENSLRLRLKQREVEEFCHKGTVGSTTRLSLQPESFIRFILSKDNAAQAIQLAFEKNVVCIRVPAKVVDAWSENSDATGFDAFCSLEEHGHLYILVEKDFRCLHKEKQTQGDRDCYPHPLERKGNQLQ